MRNLCRFLGALATLLVALSVVDAGWTISLPTGPVHTSATFVSSGMCTGDQNGIEFVVEAQRVSDNGVQCSRGGTSAMMSWSADSDNPFSPPTGGWYKSDTVDPDVNLKLYPGGSGTAAATKGFSTFN